MLFTKEFWPGLADGSITLTFRRWSRPQVKVGGSYRTPGGMIKVTALSQQTIRSITAADARRCGQPRDRLVDVFLGDLVGNRHERGMQGHQRRREHRAGNEDEKLFVTLVAIPPPASRGFDHHLGFRLR